MASRLRKKQSIPEDTTIRATLTDPKIVHGNFGRQVEAVVRVIEGGEENEYKGTTFKAWFSFGKDKDTGEEYIAYGAPLYQLFSLVAKDLEAVLEDEDLPNSDYEKFIKKSVKAVDELDLSARVGVKIKQGDENKPVKEQKRNNFLQSGTFGPYQDPDEDFEDLDMGDKEPPEEPAA
jgi:hypothetical protein